MSGLLLWRGFSWCFLCPSDFLQSPQPTFALCQFLHKLLTRLVVRLKTLPCPLDERFCLAQKDGDGSFLSCTSGLLEALLQKSGLLARRLNQQLRELLEPLRDRSLSASQLRPRCGEARFHGVSKADANGLELPVLEEPEKCSAKRQKFRAPWANVLRVGADHEQSAPIHLEQATTLGVA